MKDASQATLISTNRLGVMGIRRELETITRGRTSTRLEGQRGGEEKKKKSSNEGKGEIGSERFRRLETKEDEN